jgi:endonuclease/exonuclease/phosphatase family metal-dependent hydrolase
VALQRASTFRNNRQTAAMRLATFNLESLDEAPKAEVPLKERIAVLRPQIERMCADILCLQEVNAQRRGGQSHRTFDALDQLLDGTTYARFHRAHSLAGDHDGPADVHNLVTLSRWPIRSVRQIRHAFVPPLAYRSLTAHPASQEPQDISFERPILACDIEVADGLSIMIVNVHLRAPLAVPIRGQKLAPFVWRSASAWAEGYALAAWKRSAQALEVRLFVDDVLDSDPNARIIVAGDFNAEDHETPMKILLSAEEDTGNGLLATRSLVMLDRSLAGDRRFSTLHHGRPQMLDHILISRSLLAAYRGLEVHNETLGDELVGFGRIRPLTSSYHAPVIATFELSPLEA